jgi:hypothetical protein
LLLDGLTAARRVCVPGYGANQTVATCVETSRRLNSNTRDRSSTTVFACGRICFNRQKINLNVVFAGQRVGIKQVSEQIWLVSFMDYHLGYFDH